MKVVKVVIASFGKQSCYYGDAKKGGFSGNIWEGECYGLDCLLYWNPSRNLGLGWLKKALFHKLL